MGDAETRGGQFDGERRASSNPTLVPVGNIVVRRQRRQSHGDGDAGGEPDRDGDDHGDGQRRAAEYADELPADGDARSTIAPTITTIANQTTTQGVAVGPLAVTVGDVETAAAQPDAERGQSSNPTLVPVGNIVFGGSGANRTVTVTPAAGQTGTATITVTVSDGTATTPTSFLLTVNAAPAGLVAAYSFDAGTGPTVADVSGNNNAGTISGATWSPTGKFGGALAFNGTTARVLVPGARR